MGFAPTYLVVRRTMNNNVTNELNDAYLSILTIGLINIRNFAFNKQIKLCEVEADHLHNIPSLIGEMNINRHIYYMDKEVPSYLHYISLADYEYKDFPMTIYKNSWDTIREYIKIQTIV